MLTGLNLHVGGLIDSCAHAACHKTLPDQLVQAEQISGKLLLDFNRYSIDVRRADCLVGVLNLPGLLLFLIFTGKILFAVMFFDKLHSHCLRLL